MPLASYAWRGAPKRTDCGRAIVWLERAVRRDHRDAQPYLAAIVATAPDAELGNAASARKLLGEIMRKVDVDPTVHEIRAAAAAAEGRFDEPARHQRKALQMAQKLGRTAEPHEARLREYESERPWFGDLFALETRYFARASANFATAARPARNVESGTTSSAVRARSVSRRA